MAYVNRRNTRQMLKWVAGEHFRYRRQADAMPAPDELDLSPGIALEITAPDSPLLRQMTADFSTFMQRCMDVKIAPSGSGRTLVRFRLAARVATTAETFTISVTGRGVEISASHERGLLHASHYLEHLMADRGGPFLRRQRLTRSRQFDPYISYPVADDRANLSLMSHFGVNGMLFPMRLWDYCRNRAIPELNTPPSEYATNLAALREKCRLAAAHGIDLYLDISHWGGFPAGHPAFQAHPEIRGAEFYYSVNGNQFILCSSSPRVRQLYEEGFANLFREVAELGGISAIVGCEGLMHCFSYPKPPLQGGTNCPHCGVRKPAAVVAELANGIARAVHRVKPEARFFVWPYSADFWSGADTGQTALIRQLSPDVCFLSNFETPAPSRLNGAQTWVIDYNILNLGPSAQFAAQSKALAAKGMPHYAKTESSTSVFFFQVPYLPVHYRWHERYRRLREEGVPGLLAKWHFYGLTGSLPEELLWAQTWEKQVEPDRFLATVVRRDFGNADSAAVLRAWRQLSTAWEKIPLSHLLFGDRHGYMKGPFWLGPAHPLILDPQRDYGLSEKFVKQRAPRLFPRQPPAVIAQGNTPHQYCADLLFTFPFTPAAVEKALQAAQQAWDRATGMLEKAMGEHPSPQAAMELDVCRTIGAILRSTWNVVRFYRTRDAFFSGRGSDAVLRRRMQELQAILAAEIVQAEAILPVLERDPRLGLGNLYGQAFDADMVREKLRQCRYVRDVEIPFLTRRIRRFNFLQFMPPEDNE